MERLRNEETRRTYNEAVKRRIGRIDIDQFWEHERVAYVESAEEVLGFRKGKSKPWIRENTWKLIDERRKNGTRTERIKTRTRNVYRGKD